VQGIETEKIVLGQCKIGPCLGHKACGTYTVCKVKDDAPAIIEKFNQADAVILATPVYFFDVSAQMKAFIDRNFLLLRTRAKERRSMRD
jgi:multimeric flavodoxin WrbA